MTSESGLDNYIHLNYDLSSNTRKVRVTQESHISKCINTTEKNPHNRRGLLVSYVVY